MHGLAKGERRVLASSLRGAKVSLTIENLIGDALQGTYKHLITFFFEGNMTNREDFLLLFFFFLKVCKSTIPHSSPVGGGYPPSTGLQIAIKSKG